MYNPPKMIVDLNAQILPDMGCGPESCSEAAQILVKLGEQGVTHVVAAPRFNRYDESVPPLYYKAWGSYGKVQRLSFSEQNEPRSSACNGGAGKLYRQYG